MHLPGPYFGAARPKPKRRISRKSQLISDDRRGAARRLASTDLQHAFTPRAAAPVRGTQGFGRRVEGRTSAVAAATRGSALRQPAMELPCMTARIPAVVAVVLGSTTLLAALASFAPPAAAQVHRWVDERGVVQYGDRPPGGATRLRIRAEMATAPDVVPGTPAAAPVAAAAARALPPGRRGAGAIASTPPAAAVAATRPAPAAVQAQAAPAGPALQAPCARPDAATGCVDPRAVAVRSPR